MFRVVIPARYASTRLPAKALAVLAGKPMLQWVYERARASGAQDVLIATDDSRIADAARGFGAPVVMTAVTHVSGTDRIAEVTRAKDWPAESIVVNVQGDEPLIPPALIDQVAKALHAHPQAAIATVAAPILSFEEFLDPNAVKVVVDAQGRALYFSRAPIPANRDAPRDFANARRHIGLYAYRVGALQRIASLPSSTLENLEKLEQLRALESGLEIRVVDAAERPGPDVNTPQDLERVAERLRSTP